jgi:hypothetical protein
MPKKKDDRPTLAEVIKNNPGCWAQVDNDWWCLYSKDINELDDDEDYEEYVIADSSGDTVKLPPEEGYGSGSCYGGDLLQALAEIVGIKVESV